MTGHHHCSGGCSHHGACPTYCQACADDELRALGEVIVAPLIALGTLTSWAARRPEVLLGIAGTATVGFAVATAIEGGPPTAREALSHIAAAGGSWAITRTSHRLRDRASSRRHRGAS